MDQIIIYILICIIIGMFILLACNKHVKKKQLKERKYYSVENKNIFTYLQIFLFLSFFEVALLIPVVNNEVSLALILLLIMLPIIFILLIYFSLIQTIKFKKEKHRIMKKGIRVPGTIKDEHMQEGYGRKPKHYYMIVEFMHNGIRREYITPEVEFNLFQLASTDVDVYVSEDKVFVTNFKLRQFI